MSEIVREILLEIAGRFLNENVGEIPNKIIREVL